MQLGCRAPLLLCLAVGLPACTRPAGALEVAPPVAPTTPATATPVAPATTTPAPGAPTAAPAAAGGSCVDSARFLEDLTVPDGTVFEPGARFDKRWAVRNDGTCDWGPDYRLVAVGENRLGAPVEVALFPAAAGAIGEWQIALQAPYEPGEYLGRWRARAPDGALFGDEVFVLIFVEAPTGTPSPTALPTP